MNKNDIKKSLDAVTPDPHMKTRIKASLEARNSVYDSKKFIRMAGVACCALVALALGIGFSSLEKTTGETAELYEKYASGTVNASDGESFVPTETERHSLTPEEESIIQSEIGYWEPVTSPDNPNALLSNPNPPTRDENNTLIVKGKDISDSAYVDFSPIKKYTEIALMPVLRELCDDADFIWTSDTTAQITANGKKYVLNTDPYDFTLKLNGEGENLLTPSPGVADGTVHRIVDGEFIIDHHSIGGLLNEMGYVIVVDYENRVINIQ